MNKNRENWRSVVGFEGLYEVSDYGRVRSWKRTTKTGVHGGGLLKPSTDRQGRRTVCLSCNGNRVNKRVHQLVLESFVGPKPKGMECCHFPDSNPANNYLTNLRWDTRVNNQADRLVHGTSNRGGKHGMSKLVNVDVERIRDIRLIGQQTYPVIAEYFNVSISTIGQILRRTAWQHV